MTRESLERAIIGSLIFESGMIPKVKGFLTPSDFSSTYANKSYGALLELWDSRTSIDIVTLKDKVTLGVHPEEQGDVLDVIVGCIESVPNASNVQSYARMLKELNVREQMEGINSKLTEAYKRNASTPEIEEITREFEVVASQLKTPIDLSAISDEVVTDMERNCQGYDLTTGMGLVDQYIMGLSRKRFYVAAGDTSHGKTAVSVFFTFQNLMRGNKVNYYTFDLSSKDIWIRLLGVFAKIPMEELTQPVTDPKRRAYIKEESERMAKKFDGLLTIKEYVRLNEIEKDLSEDQCGLVVIDYLQTAFAGEKMGKSSVAWGIGQYIARLKKMADRYNVCVLGLSQFSRPMSAKEAGSQYRPRTIHDLKESGYIEQGANVIMLLDWEYKRKKEADMHTYTISVAKSSFGRTETIYVHFDPTYQIFKALDDSGPVESDTTPYLNGGEK